MQWLKLLDVKITFQIVHVISNLKLTRFFPFSDMVDIELLNNFGTRKGDPSPPFPTMSRLSQEVQMWIIEIMVIDVQLLSSLQCKVNEPI